MNPTINAYSENNNPQKFRILALDGGGLKGVFEAAFLAAIEEDLGVSIIYHFDLITGTSTGSIIAMGLGMGLSAARIQQFYLEKGRSIFPYNESTDWLKRLSQFKETKHKTDGLQQALLELFGDRLLGGSKTPLIIPC